MLSVLVFSQCHPTPTSSTLDRRRRLQTANPLQASSNQLTVSLAEYPNPSESPLEGRGSLDRQTSVERRLSRSLVQSARQKTTNLEQLLQSSVPRTRKRVLFASERLDRLRRSRLAGVASRVASRRGLYMVFFSDQEPEGSLAKSSLSQQGAKELQGVP